MTEKELRSEMIDPLARARRHARVELPKRFYDKVQIVRSGSEFCIELDEKPAHTPGGKPLQVATETLAEALAREWSDAGEQLDPIAMPLTRLANTALDGVSDAMESVRADIVNYARTDLVCYRADEPAGLVEMQVRAWEPILEWAQQHLQVRFILVTGIVHQPQPDSAISAVAKKVDTIVDALPLAALHTATTLTGSALIPLALSAGEIAPKSAWAAAHVDEEWNIHQWGRDAEADARRQIREREFAAAALVLTG